MPVNSILLVSHLVDPISALFILYDAAILSPIYTENERNAFVSSLETTSQCIAAFSQTLFANPTGARADESFFSPFIPYSIYQAAVVQDRIWRRTGQSTNKDALDVLRGILGTFRKRWHVADTYVKQLNSRVEQAFGTIYFINGGRSMSRKGPTGDSSRPYAS